MGSTYMNLPRVYYNKVHVLGGDVTLLHSWPRVSLAVKSLTWPQSPGYGKATVAGCAHTAVAGRDQ